MPIYAADHKLMLAEDMSQDDTGGGRMSGREAPNGQVGTLFAKLSRLTFLGKFRAAKAYQAVLSPTADTAGEAHVVLTRGPGEALVDVLLFRTGSHTDRLPDAKNYVANYLVPGAPAQMYLYGSTVAGQDVAQWWQRVDQPAPRVGEVYRIQAGANYDDIKLISVDSQELTLYDNEGVAYVRRVLTCRLFAALAHAYTGHPIGKADVSGEPLTRGMLANGAVRYYGVKPLAEDAAAEDGTVVVEGIYGQLVPAVYAPTALTNRPAVASGRQIIRSGGVDFSVAGPVHCRAITINTGNQDSVYVMPLSPAPAADSAVAHVRILDQWYLVVEDPALNEPGMTLSVSNGVATLTLGSAGFPDLGSLLIIQHASSVHFVDRAGTAAIQPITIVVDLPEDAEQGTVTAAWLSGGAAKSAAEASTGLVSGHCTGFRVGRKLALRFTANIPDGGTQITVQYQPLETVTEIISVLPVGGNATFSLADAPRPGSLRLSWTVGRTEAARYKTQNYRLRAWGSYGSIGGSGGSNGITVIVNATEVADSGKTTETRAVQDDGAGGIDGGTVVYGTGAVTVPVVQSSTRKTYTVATVDDSLGVRESGSWSNTDVAEQMESPITATYALASSSPGAVATLAVDVPALEIPLLPGLQDTLIPGTWRFSLGSKSYREDTEGNGTLYLSDGVTAAGTMDYVKRVATVTNWSGAGAAVTISSGVSAYGMPHTQRIIGRTDGAPLSVGQFFLRAVTLAGVAVTGQGQSDETVTGSGIAAGSEIRWDIGAFDVAFNAPVHPGAVYDTVVQEVLPLSEDQIDIDATRLPRDGRVPIYRQSDAVLIHQTAEADMPSPLSAGQVVAVGVTDLARVDLLDHGGDELTEALPSGLGGGDSFQVLATAPAADRLCEYLLLKDADGRHVSGNLFSADLETALITMANPLSLAGYTEPLRARYVRQVRAALYSANLAAGTITMATPMDLAGLGYTEPLLRRVRWEDQSRLLSVQVDGSLRLQNPINHAYDAGMAMVSGIVEHGDLRAKVALLFGQQTWSGTWSDTVSGTAKEIYDSANYPPGITNAGAINAQMAVVFTSATAFSFHIADRGVVATGTKSTDFAPVNPATGAPYIRLYAAGWSVDTATGNALRINTEACAAPVWVAMCISAGDPTVADDSFRLELRLDSD